jgi:hypothetical protein
MMDAMKYLIGDMITSSMSFDESRQLWTIFAANTRTKANTTLHVTKVDTHNTGNDPYAMIP